MGMFDTVMVPCPVCGTTAPFQSKGGDCLLTEYTLENAPADVLSDVNRHAPALCMKCATQFKVKLQISARSVQIEEEEPVDSENPESCAGRHLDDGN